MEIQIDCAHVRQLKYKLKEKIGFSLLALDNNQEPDQDLNIYYLSYLTLEEH